MTDKEIREISQDITNRLRKGLPVATTELEAILTHTINSEFRSELMFRKGHPMPTFKIQWTETITAETEVIARSEAEARELFLQGEYPVQPNSLANKVEIDFINEMPRSLTEAENERIYQLAMGETI